MHPKEHAHDRGTHGHRTQVMGFGKSPDDGGIHHAEKWHGEIGKDQRDSETKRLAIGNQTAGLSRRREVYTR